MIVEFYAKNVLNIKEKNKKIKIPSKEIKKKMNWKKLIKKTEFLFYKKLINKQGAGAGICCPANKTIVVCVGWSQLYLIYWINNLILGTYCNEDHNYTCVFVRDFLNIQVYLILPPVMNSVSLFI